LYRGFVACVARKADSLHGVCARLGAMYFSKTMNRPDPSPFGTGRDTAQSRLTVRERKSR
jgi:hypothetical protein